MNNNKEKKKIAIRYGIFNVGIFLNYTGYLVFTALQSSINIEEGVGTASLTATFATAAAFGVLVTPILLRKLGPKLCLLLCEFAYMAYILANAYPVAYTLIPAGVLTGMGEATMWPVMSLFVVHYARCYARHGEQSTDAYMTQFIGIFFSLFQLSGVCGNLLGYAVLFGGSSSNQPNNNDNTTTAETPIVKDLSICGKNDCQDPNVTNNNSERYEPASQTLIYILVGVTSASVMMAILFHGFLTKTIDKSLEVQDNDEEKKELEEEKSILMSMFLILKETFFHIINPRQILLTPFALYSGLLLSFGFNEVTRAFGSCMLGVEQVGLLAALFASADAISSFWSCRIASWIGRDVPLIFGYFLDISNYMICLFWIPTESTLWVVYIIFMMVGLADGIWQPLINELHASVFPKNRDIALSVWNMFTQLGIVWQTSWSTSVCMYLKIYIQIGFLTFSLICYGIHKKLYGKEVNEADVQKETLETKL